MSKYEVPYIFRAGTKASAEEVNSDFEYIASILDNIGTARYPFCVNYGQRNKKGLEDLFEYSGSEVKTKTGPKYQDFAYTDGYGSSRTFEAQSSTIVHPTKYSSIIPMMTSDIIGEFSCAATSEEAGHESYHAFDKNIDSYWGSFIGVTNATLAIALDAQYVADYYYIKVLTPGSWTLEASNDDRTWVLLDEYSVAEPSTITRKLDIKGQFQTYRINMTVYNDTYQIMIAEFDLYEKAAAGDLGFNETQILYATPDGLEAINNKYFVQDTQPVGVANYKCIIPEMVSNLIPDGYRISASSFSAENPPYLATDRQDSSYWEATNQSAQVWFQVQVPNSVNAKACKLTLSPNNDALEKALINGSLLGSNNGLTWTTLYTFKNLEWSRASESKFFYFSDNETKFTYYRLVGEAPFASLGEFQLFALDSNGEYVLGQAFIGDVWFKCTEPFECYRYVGSNSWTTYLGAPAGEVRLDSDGQIVTVETYPYNQNGYNINGLTTKKNSGNIVTYDSYSSYLNSSGYTVLPSKLIIQWGTAEGSQQILYPMTFPNAVFSVIANPVSSSPDVSSHTSNVNKSGFMLQSDENIKSYWIAIGW